MANDSNTKPLTIADIENCWRKLPQRNFNPCIPDEVLLSFEKLAIALASLQIDTSEIAERIKRSGKR